MLVPADERRVHDHDDPLRFFRFNDWRKPEQ
jgi:hypothetical protein